MTVHNSGAPATEPAPTWDDDPDGASIILTTGRSGHDLLVVAEPALLTELDEAWGRPESNVRLSLLPGVPVPKVRGQEDSLYSYTREGLSVLLARGRSVTYEGRTPRETTALARIVAASGVRAAFFLTRASSLAGAAPGDFVSITDHLNLTGGSLFPAVGPVAAAWDADLGKVMADVDGVRGAGTAALVAGPVRPTPAEAAMMAGLGADVAVMDSVAEAMAMAARGVRVAGLAYVDHATPAASGQRAQASARRSAPVVVREAVEAVLKALS